MALKKPGALSLKPLLAMIWMVLPAAPAAAEEALVAVAANFRDAAEALKSEFEANTGHDIILTTGSTGQLYAQIRNGAPYDVLLAADQVRPQKLEEDGEIVGGSRFTYARGALALWAPQGGGVSAAVLDPGGFRALAIANPKLAPYGAAAVEVLEALELYAALEGRLVRGQNVAQAYALVASGNAELGFVALSQLIAEDADEDTYWHVPDTLHAPIRQDAVRLKIAEGNEAAIDFLAFLKGDEAGAILREFGYEPR